MATPALPFDMDLANEQAMDQALAGQDPNRPPPGTTAPVETGIPQEEAELPAAQDFGLNNEKLPKKYQDMLKDLLIQALDAESKESRREEVRRIRQAREFWKGLQYNYYNAEDERWHLPWETVKANTDDQSPDDLPRYMFVTNYYQAFGLSIIAVLSQDIPKVRPWPQDPDTPADRTTAKAATTIIELVERNNSMNLLMTDEAFYLWTDGKIGGFVRYVTDGSRFGYHDEPELGERQVKLGEDSYGCQNCGTDTPASQFMGMCGACGNDVPDDRFRPAELVSVPMVQRTIKTPNGAEVITIVGGLELKTPPWARYQWEFPYLGWDIEVHRARLAAAWPKKAKEIKQGAGGGDKGSGATNERTARLSVATGHSGEPGADLVTFRRGWLRPWMFYMIEVDADRDFFLAQFPEGAYVALAGDVYLESRNESMDDCWEVEHALPGDGQDRPALGTSFISVQERINTLSNITMETAEYGIPSTFVNTAVIDIEALGMSYCVPGAMYPGNAPAGTSMKDAFTQTTASQVSGDVVRHQEQLQGPVGQFLTGAFPALFGADPGTDTVGGTVVQRDQALGRIGLVWRRMQDFHARLMMKAVNVFRKNRPDDVKFPILGEGGDFEAKVIAKADLKGNISCYSDTDNQYPTVLSQKKQQMQALLQNPDPIMQRNLGHPDNLATVFKIVGLDDLVVPDEEARQKQYNEITLLLQEDPIQEEIMGPMGPQLKVTPSVPVDMELDNHGVELAVIQRWLNTPAGQEAKNTNPMGFANVRAHAIQHQQAMMFQAQQAAMIQAGGAPPPAPEEGAGQAGAGAGDGGSKGAGQ